MDFLSALKSGKRFRPKKGYSDDWFMAYKKTIEDLDLPRISYRDYLGEWEIEELPCKHEPEEIIFIQTAPKDLQRCGYRPKCKHCGVQIKSTGWIEDK